MSKRTKPSFTTYQYARGASNALNVLVKSILEKKMSPDEAMSLIICFANTVKIMRKESDRQPPFLTKAMAKTLDLLGIERYQDAFDRMTSNESSK